MDAQNTGKEGMESVMKTVNEMMEAARKYQVVNLSVFEKAFSEIEKMLRPDEDVLCAFTGSSAQRKNSSMLWFVGVALTNQRLLIGGQIKGLLKVSYTAQSFNIENINAISQSWSAIGGDLIIDTLGDDIRIGESARDVVNSIIVDFDTVLQSVKTPKNGAVIQQASVADELKKFKELLDMGVITQEEFDAKKKQLLGL